MSKTQDAATRAAEDIVDIFDVHLVNPIKHLRLAVTPGDVPQIADIIRRECGLEEIVELLRNCRGYISLGFDDPSCEELRLVERIDAALARLG